MFYYLKRVAEKTRKYLFDRQLFGILELPPLETGEGLCTALSMVHHRDVLSYLLALRSFARYVPLKGVVVVADPSITPNDRDLLTRHIPQIRFVEAKDQRNPDLPVGGCWERLTALIKESTSDYVIQLDADTVTLSEPTHVIKAINSGRSFTLGTYDLQSTIEAEELSRWASTHCRGKYINIQLICEAALNAVTVKSKKNSYIRGCAGFAGVAKGAIQTEDLLYFSKSMSETIGKRWSDWGTEQFTSNYLIANTFNPVVLPHPVYCNPDRTDDSTVFIHFIGYLRFTNRLYERTAKRVINVLKTSNKSNSRI